jgi:tripartite ATP-independent transporter DctP family solute receptor
MKGTRLIALALLIIGLTVAPVSAQQPIVLRLAHTGAPGSLFDISAVKFATRVHEVLQGRVEIKVSGSSQIGTSTQVMRGLKIGAPEMAIISTEIDTVEPRFGVFEMPYLIVNRAQVHKAAEHPKVQAALFDPLLTKAEMRVLGMYENGVRHITNNVRPIEKPEDLKGLKLRVPPGAWRVKMFKAYGASPQPIPLVEVYNALKSGAVDGEENPLSQIASQNFQEVQKYLSMTGHVYSPAVLVIGQSTWMKLPKDVQTTLAKIGHEVGDFSRAEGERLDKALLKTLAPPMKLNEVNKDAFIKASAAIYEDFGQQVPGGKELIALIQSLR